MKKLPLVLLSGLFVLASLGSCNKKHGCHECHYENEANEEVEIGEYCDDDLEAIENSGYQANGTTYEVHCHDH